jgi:hypothetical protein
VLRQLGIGRQDQRARTGDQALSDDELRGKTDEFKQRIAGGERSTSCCRKPSRSAARPRRVLGMRHYDVQLIGGMVLHWARSPKCAPAKARRWSPRCRSTSTR